MAYKIYHGKRDFFSNLSATNQLILINIIFYIISIFILRIYGQEFFYNNLALTPSLDIFYGNKIWTFLTSMFFHGPFFHIFANMFSLFFIGNFLERIIGKKRFISIYLVSGILGGIFFVLSGIIFSNNMPGIGASGAIFGILGVLAVLVPYSKIYLIVGPLILILAQVIISPFVPINLISIFSFIINLLIILMIFSIFSFNPSTRKFAVPLELPMWLLPIIAIVPLVIINFIPQIPKLPIGNSAHIGGLVLGIFYGFYLKNKFPRKTKMIRRHFR